MNAFSTNAGDCCDESAFKPTLFNPTEEHAMLREMVFAFSLSENLGPRFCEK